MIAGDPRLQFVLTEIDLGITFVQRAVTAYQGGFHEHGDSAIANAVEALKTAKRFIGHLDTKGQQIASAELPRLEQALKGRC